MKLKSPLNIRFIATLLLIALPGMMSVHAAAKPNIVVIMADDMGYADAGFTGAKDIKTPNLDRLAASGVIFSQGYANHPFCAPTRAALLTGRYQHRFGFETNPAYDPANPVMGLDPAETLFPERLQKVGYVTGGIGKWHLGAAAPFHPNNRGLDYYYGFLGGGHDYFKIDLTKPVKEAYEQPLIRNDKPATFDGYLTTALSRDAVSFIEANKAKPFFLYLAYNAPHAPQQAPKEDIARYASIKDPKRRTYAAMVDVMDRGIGEVLSALETNGLRENTLVFFLSDNGGPQGSENNPGSWNGSSNAPFRGGKGNLYDGGVHVPFIASWPARLPAGKRYDFPVIALDISRTAVEQAGANATSGKGMEGVDLIPYVLGEKPGAPHDALYWRADDGRRWSILAADGTKHVKDQAKPELFHLPDDVSETRDLSVAQPERAKELLQKWEAWDKLNVPCRMIGYKEYHKLRDGFFIDAIPKHASETGYHPEIKGSFGAD